MNRIIAFILALLALTLSLSACVADNKPTETEQPVFDVVIAETDMDCTIVLPEKYKNDTHTYIDAVELFYKFKEKFGCNVAIKDDWYNPKAETIPETAREILVGPTNRKETQDELKKIRANDFVIKYENERIVITGGNDVSTDRAYRYFIENYFDKADGKLFIPSNLYIHNKFDYVYKSAKIDGEDLRNYTVVYPDKADSGIKYAAYNLADYVLSSYGVEIPVVSDKTAETELELLIGETNRTASQEAGKKLLANDEFLLAKSGKKVVMLGKDYMCAGAAGKLMNVCLAPTGTNCEVDAKNIPAISEARPEKQVWGETKNIILMIGDGMGRNHVLAAIADGKLDRWYGDSFPGQAYCTTASRSVQLGRANCTDSAAAATALACGYKTINGYVGIDENTNTIKSVRELANEIGAKSSVITTDVITGSTPAGFLAHNINCKNTDEIQKQIDECIADNKVQYCKGSLGDKLFASTRESLSLISENGARFFTMIEEAYPDKGSHDNDMMKAISGVVRLNDSVKYAAAFVMMHPDTALLITADHETGGITQKDGTYVYTLTSHTNADVPIYGIGAGVETFLASGSIDNLDISRFMAKAYGTESWGQN